MAPFVRKRKIGNERMYFVTINIHIYTKLHKITHDKGGLL